jgi:GlpG protein
MSGPLFLGISGVVFGLLGYVWMKGKFDPRAGMHLPQGVVFMMLLWVFLGISGAIESMTGMRVANTAHVAGLIAGCVLGILSVVLAKARA